MIDSEEECVGSHQLESSIVYLGWYVYVEICYSHIWFQDSSFQVLFCWYSCLQSSAWVKGRLSGQGGHDHPCPECPRSIVPSLPAGGPGHCSTLSVLVLFTSQAVCVIVVRDSMCCLTSYILLARSLAHSISCACHALLWSTEFTLLPDFHSGCKGGITVLYSTYEPHLPTSAFS